MGVLGKTVQLVNDEGYNCLLPVEVLDLANTIAIY
jgi:hypothetical protein